MAISMLHPHSRAFGLKLEMPDSRDGPFSRWRSPARIGRRHLEPSPALLYWTIDTSAVYDHRMNYRP
jgi:hypothetical protein